MVTMGTVWNQTLYMEQIEEALDCMEQAIRHAIRKVDICTRYSAMQYLIILFEPQESQISKVMERSSCNTISYMRKEILSQITSIF